MSIPMGRYNFFSMISGVLLFLFCLSGRFTTERIGLGDYEVRFILAFVCSIWAAVAITYKGIGRRGWGVVCLCLLFFFVSAIFAFRNEAGGLVVDKTIDVGVLTLLVVLSYILLSNDFVAVKVFLICMGLVGLLYSLLVLLSVGDAARGSTGVGGPNVATRIMFMGLVSLVFFAEYTERKILYLISPVYLAGIVGVGSRGGMLVAFAMVAGWLFIQMVKTFSEGKSLSSSFVSFFKKILVFFVVAGGFVWLFFPVVSKVFQSRFVNLLVDKVHYAGRDEIYASSVSTILDNALLGLGLGGYEKIGISNYPHNIVLELFLDGGVFLGVFFLLFLGLAFYSFFKSKASVLSTVGLYMILVQMFSGDYYDFRFYFIYMLIVFSFFVLHCKSKVDMGRGVA